ncbi:hypothetical protein Agabi119p4_10847 [Agaricus bisporus var. burnettii]|uniref:mRNA export factor GLE1 n=1 Tax=Agaricus bisporus var. burnettii TaxID=192524 RepID=A0A8H7C0N2_AGABI|nr:hypothetical protein Agabi119p4_10847 [Agaricus bisporus var. burnettii]
MPTNTFGAVMTSPTSGLLRRSTYGLPSHFDDSDCDSDSDVIDDTDSSDESLSYSISDDETSSDSEDEPFSRSTLSKSQRSPDEVQQLAETLASIRLRTRHHDPYEDWERQTRKDAFATARKELSASNTQFQTEQERLCLEESRKLVAQHDKRISEVRSWLENRRSEAQKNREALIQAWTARKSQLWNDVKEGIRYQEEKIARELEEEKKRKEEEERQRREEELRRTLAEAKRREEAEKMKKEEEERLRQEEELKKKENIEQQTQQQEQRQKKEFLEAEKASREQLGLKTEFMNWADTRYHLKSLKAEIAIVKADRNLRAAWGNCRRHIKPKVGQLTNDLNAIQAISQEVLNVLRPPTPHDFRVFLAILSSFAKDILLQAEVEITAEKRSAIPLAQLTFNILASVPEFADVFFAKLVQRVGGWPIPYAVPNQDYDGRKWENNEERLKVMGFRKSEEGNALESEAELSSRAAGIMRVYFLILQINPPHGPLSPMFQTTRYWSWFARILDEKSLMQSPITAELIYTALNVMGHDALQIWGGQWIKLLALIYEGVTVGFGSNRCIGGQTPEGRASRVRVQLEIERIMSTIT